MSNGVVYRVTGPVVAAKGLEGAKMFDVVRVGDLGLVGEVIRLQGDTATLQIYEDTTGLRPGEKVVNTGQALSVELGPGLLKSIYDGIQSPLERAQGAERRFHQQGPRHPSARREEEVGLQDAEEGRRQGHPRTRSSARSRRRRSISHKIMVPPGVSGELKELKAGSFTIREQVGTIKTAEGDVPVFLAHKWRVRMPRPLTRKLPPDTPLLTGQRVFDTFFPLAKGGTAAIPGPFGSGKTVTQQQLAKWSDASIIVYVGCGERGNEMTEVLATFPRARGPQARRGPLMERTILVANTSNMPVAAREASIYTGITIAEYYRDMGYDVALMADSTSRWAEAMREISGRLEEMPGEEGYPAYLGRRLAEFYERAGARSSLCRPRRQAGSVTVVGAVSPPGGDFSEPVSQNTLRVTRVFWALDASLAARSHFPSINWLKSYSLYTERPRNWYRHQHREGLGRPSASEALGDAPEGGGAPGHRPARRLRRAPRVARRGSMDVAKMHPGGLPPAERLRPGGHLLLHQEAVPHDQDASSTLAHMEAEAIKTGATRRQVAALPVKSKISKIKWTPEGPGRGLHQGGRGRHGPAVRRA